VKKAGEKKDDAGAQNDAGEQNDTSAVTEPPDLQDILAERTGGENAIDA
jgi:hypothetical protein